MTEMSEIRRELARWAEEAAGCRLLVLFGSGGAGRARAESDVDLAVAFESLPPPDERLRIIGELEDRCGGRRVDVVFLRPGTDPVLRHQIFRHGRSLYEAEPGLFVEERVRAVMLYEDALPFRRALRRRMAGS